MADPTNPPPRPPGPWDHEDPPDIRPGFVPKKPKKPDLTPRPSKDVTLGWTDEPAAPGDYEEIVRRAGRPLAALKTVESSADWKGILSAARDGAPIPPGYDDCDPHGTGVQCPACALEE